MRLITVSADNFDGERIHDDVEAGNVVLVKNLLPQHVMAQLRDQLLGWRAAVPGEDPKVHYPAGKRNLHMEVRNYNHTLGENKLEYYEDHTVLDVYNYRVGDMSEPAFLKHVPVFSEIGPPPLQKYLEVVRAPYIRHGNWDGRNLYFEIAHYHCRGGFIDKHTHVRNMEMGQRINMVTMMSQRARDFDHAGLYFEEGDTCIDTTLDFNEGDSVFFRMDIPHWVTPVKEPDIFSGEPSGRWTITTFYY